MKPVLHQLHELCRQFLLSYGLDDFSVWNCTDNEDCLNDSLGLCNQCFLELSRDLV